MSDRARLDRFWKAFGFGCILFAFGFMLFWFSSVRFGPHFMSVRQYGARVDLERVLKECDLPKHRSVIVHCLSVEFIRIIPRWGLEALVAALTERRSKQLTNDLSVTRCHDVTHQFGKISVQLGVSLKEILTSCTELCQSGCFHGAAVGWVAKGESLGKNFTSICLTKGISEDKKKSCIHGMGHAVAPMGLYDVKKSLMYCDIYADIDRDNCGSGVFMEVYDGTEYNNGVLRDLPPDRPAWCEQFEASYKEVCYSTSGYFEYSRSNDLQGAIAICRKEPQQYQFDCLTLLGKRMYFTIPLSKDQINGIESFCQIALPNQYDECVRVVKTDYIH